MSETASDRPWWADVEHLRPTEGDAGATPPERARRQATGRFQRRPGWTTATATETRELVEAATAEHTAEPRRPKVDFDFDAGIASLLDAPAEPQGTFEWIDLSADDEPAVADWFGEAPAASADDARAVDWLALEEAVTPAPKPLDDRRTELSADDRASGWRSDVWDIAKPAAAAAPVRRRPPRTAAERLAGRPDRIALWAFLLGLLLIAIAAIGTPKANAATIDAAAAQQTTPIVVTVDGP